MCKINSGSDMCYTQNKMVDGMKSTERFFDGLSRKIWENDIWAETWIKRVSHTCEDQTSESSK